MVAQQMIVLSVSTTTKGGSSGHDSKSSLSKKTLSSPKINAQRMRTESS